MTDGNGNGGATALQTKQESRQAISMGRMGIQLKTLEEVFRFAQCVVDSNLAPKGMNAQGATVVIQMGFELGLPPMQALQGIAPINGRPAIFGDLLPGLVEASGLQEDFEETFEGKPFEDDYKAVCRTKRRGRSGWTVQEFSVADAKLAKLWSKAGPWTEHPKRMLKMRARAFALRDTYPDVLRGLVTREEAEDYIDTTAREVDKEAPAKPKTIDELATNLERTAAKSQPPADTSEAEAGPSEGDNDTPPFDPETGEIVNENTEAAPAAAAATQEGAAGDAKREERLF